MRYSNSKYEMIDTQVQRLLAIYPNISAKKISETLGLDYNLICRRVNKVQRRAIEEIKRMTVEEDLSDIRTFLEATLPELTKIIFDKEATNKDKIQALKTIVEGKKVFLDKKFDAGIFERQIGKIKTENSLAKDDKEIIAQALQYAFLPDKPTKDNRGDTVQPTEPSGTVAG